MVELTVDTIRQHNKDKQISAILGQRHIGKLLEQIDTGVKE